jgi:hypothetical protein
VSIEAPSLSRVPAGFFDLHPADPRAVAVRGQPVLQDDALEDGEDLAVVSRSRGHSNLLTTADTYAHITPAMQARSAARMDRILAKAS